MRGGALTVLLLVAAGLRAQTFAVRAERIYPVAGPPVAPGVVVVQAGKIAAVGGPEVLPAGVPVLPLAGAVITPGFVDCDLVAGLKPGDRNEESAEVLPAFRPAAALDPRDPRFQRALRAGITTAFVGPGSRAVVGGLGATWRLTDRGAVLLKADTGLRVALGAEPSAGNRPARRGLPTSMYVRRPTTRMGVVWLLRQLFLHYQAGVGLDPEERAVLDRVTRGHVPLRVHARMDRDLRAALNVAAEFDGYRLRLLMDEATEAWRLPEDLARFHVGVILGPVYARPRTAFERREGYARRLDLAARLERAGVPFAFRSAGDPPERLRDWGILAVRWGASPAAVLRGLTLTGARFLGVADRVGTLEVGKDADFVVWSGEPLAPTSRVVGVVVAGRVVVPPLAAGEGKKP